VFLDDRQNNVDGAIACGISAIRFTGYEDARQKLKEYGVEC
jgi:putative hydrolase of the HAD superfamily